MRERYVTTLSGIRIHVVEAGSSKSPPVVFFPGWGCNAWIFHDTLVPLAANGYHAIVVELKGHGLSDKPQEPDEYTLDSMRDHVLEILDALELSQCGVVGHSMSGVICACAADKDPGRFSRIVLAAPVGFAGVRGMKFFQAITPRFIEPILPWLASRWFLRLMLNIVYGSLRRPTSRDIDELHSQVRTPGFTTALRNLLHRFDWDSRFPELPMPVLALAGSEDILSPANEIGRYGRSVVIQHAGHVLFDEAPEKVNSLLAEFFAPMRESYISTST